MRLLRNRTFKLVFLSVHVFVTLAMGISQEQLGYMENKRNSLCKKVHLIGFLSPYTLSNRTRVVYPLVEFDSETFEESSSIWGEMSCYRITHEFLEFLFVATRRRRHIITCFQSKASILTLHLRVKKG